MHRPNLSFAKIVATPTDTAWSQAYNAGSLFAVVSLETDMPTEEQQLTSLGKSIISNLEAEFFTLEKKDLATIKQAVHTSLKDIHENIRTSVVISYVKDTILYVLLYGAGSILLKRDDTIGILLSRETNEKDLLSASGFLKNNDIILLKTKQFADLVSEKDLQKSLELALPSDIAETLSPSIHAGENGAASCIIVTFSGVPDTPATGENIPQSTVSEDEQTLADSMEEASHDQHSKVNRKRTFSFPNVSFSSFPIRFPRSRKKLGFLILAVILLMLLVGSISITVKKQQDLTRQQEFQKVFAAANSEYDEGLGLVGLNKNLAREDFLAAKKHLDEGLPKFPVGSDEEKKLRELLEKVEAQLSGSSNARSVTPKKVDSEESPLLSLLLEDSTAKDVAQSDTALFAITDDDIKEYTSPTANGETLLENDKAWSDIGGFGTYLSNLYVLDKKEGVLKFVAGADGYGKTSYFSDDPPDLSKATDMAIDGSIWILFSDGNIMKFTRGVQDTFSVKQLEKPFRNATRIVTTTEGNALYVLDQGNSRIVVINKDGTYKSEYVASSLSKATALDVNETDKKLHFIADKNLWEIDIK